MISGGGDGNETLICKSIERLVKTKRVINAEEKGLNKSFSLKKKTSFSYCVFVFVYERERLIN